MRTRTVLVGLAVLAAAWAQAADSFPIGVYPVPRVDAALELDGKLDDASWQAAPLVSGFTLFETDTLCEVQTAFRVLYDDEYLYFGIHCDEPKMAQLLPTRVPLDEHGIFRTETIELFLDPGHTHNLYYQLAFNAGGSLYDGERESTHWNSDATVRTHLGEDFWSVELAVPWRKLGGEVVPGRVLGFNVNRDRHLSGNGEWMTWARVQGGFHDPDRFAHLVLSGTPEMIGALGEELRKGNRTGSIHVYSPEGFSQQSYSGLAAATLDGIERLLKELEGEREREKDPAAAAELGRRLEEHRTQLAEFRKRAGEQMDAAEWSRLDVEMQRMTPVLREVIWDARLSAILESF